MKWCVQFPEETMLIVRPCLVAICGGNRPAAKLLSVLLYRYSIRKEHKEDAENLNELKVARGETADQDTTYRIYRRQAQLVDDMCGEMTEKTLHDVAVPTLQLFGYLDIEESLKSNCYILHLDMVKQALAVYVTDQKKQPQLEKFLIANLQLEKFLIDVRLEKFPIDKKKFLLALEKVLIQNRNTSNCQRGRKPRPEAAQEAISEEPQNIEISIENNTKESTLPAVPTSPTASSHDEDAHTLLSSEQERISHEQPMVPHGRGTQERLELPGSSARNSDTRNNATLPDPMDHHLSPHLQPAQSAHRTLERTPQDDAHTPSPGVQSESARVSSSQLPAGDATRHEESKQADSLIASTTSTPSQPEPAKAARKPRAPKAVDDGLQARIERVYAFFDTLGQEVTEDTDYHYRKTKKATEAITEWLKSSPTEAILREVYLKLWNTPADQQTGFHWQDNMSIAAVLNQYDRMALSIKASRKNGKSNLHLVASSPRDSGLKSYSREELLRLPV